MKRLSLILVVCILATACTNGVCRDRHRSKCYRRDFSLFCDEDVDVKLDDGSIVFVNRDEDETVEITDEYELYIDGRRIELNAEQREMVEEYHNRVYNIVDYAKRLGIEGAKIGASGVKLGFTAIAKVVKLLSEDYDAEDLEEEMEREAEKLERKAERLERKAERIEEMAEELEDLHYELRRSVPELRDVDWF